jgi:two-component system, cell cycle sensor histidine kinase and response regulator CckA
MTEQLRKTGIPFVGAIPWGTHFCLFYETKEDLLAILIPYFKAGLENNEYCLWLVSEPLSLGEAKSAVVQAIPDAEQHLTAQHIEILPQVEWYLEGDGFDLDRVIKRLHQKLDQALAGGCAGMRLSGNPDWLRERSLTDFLEYERALDELTAKRPMLVSCTYQLAKSGASEVFEKAHTHQTAGAMRNGKWEILETPELKQAKTEIERLNEELERRVKERTKELAMANERLRKEMIERQQAQDELREREANLAEAQRVAKIGNWCFNLRNNKVRWSDELYRIFEIEKPDFDGRYESFVNLVHPDDQPRVLRTNFRARGDGAPFDLEYRVITPDRRVKTIREVGYAIRDDTGNVIRIFGTAQDITNRKKLEEALRQSEEKYRLVVQKAQEGILVAQDHVIRFVNPKALEILARSEQEVLSTPFTEFIHPDDRERIYGHHSRRLRGEQFFGSYSHRILTGDGAVKWVQITANTISWEGETAALIFFTDVTDLKRADEERIRLVTAIEQAAEAVMVTDVEGTIVYANPSFGEITGYSREEVIGNNPRILKSGQHDDKFYKHMLETISKGAVWRGRITNKKKGGALFEEDGSISPIKDDSGRIVNYVSVKRDVTKEVSLQAQLLQAQKMEAIGTLAGGIAHDFNNLLQVTLGYSELMLQGRQPEDKDYADLQKIFQSAKSGAELVRRLLTFSRKVEFKPIPLNLNRQIVQVEGLLRRTIPKMIDIRMDLSDDLAEVNADPTQVEQILMNLAVNARDAISDRGKLTIATKNVTLDEEYCKIHVGAKPGEYVMLSVSDTGHGMTKETIQHIFEPFYTTKELGRGTGLGLAMVYGIVTQHDGFITCYSEVGLGTTFGIYLPAIESPMESVLSDSGIMPAFGTETILLVDDEEFIRDLGSRVLSKAGYKALIATNGKEALDLFEREGRNISLVILDLIMPEMGGKECLAELRKIDPQLKVLIASGYPVDTSMKESAELTAQGFVNKPFRMKELLRQVRKTLDES